MASEVAVLRGEVKEYQLQLETVQSGLESDPSNTELQSLKTELEEIIALTEATILELKPVSAPTPQAHTSYKSSRSNAPPTSPPPLTEKWSKENHPAFQAGYRHPPPPIDATLPASTTSQTHRFAVNDTVLARWTSGDNAFYPARITSITGASSSPVYIVLFKSYATTETLSSRDIKPISSSTTSTNNPNSPSTASFPDLKRKLTSPPHGLSTPSFNTNSTTITASASLNPDAAAADASALAASMTRSEPSRVSDGPTRPAKVPRKVKATKELEAGKSKWQDFAAKVQGGKVSKIGGGKGVRKGDSMFRTPEGVGGRVGFTGSGSGMRQEGKRERHVYERDGGNED